MVPLRQHQNQNQHQHTYQFQHTNQNQNQLLTQDKTKSQSRTSILQQTSSSDEDLTNNEISRYSRHLVLGDVGMKGQKDLKNASVLVIGAGGLGSPCLLYLAAAGVGHIGIVVSQKVNRKFGPIKKEMIRIKLKLI